MNELRVVGLALAAVMVTVRHQRRCQAGATRSRSIPGRLERRCRDAQDLIVAAVNDAQRAVTNEMKSKTAGMLPPKFNLPRPLMASVVARRRTDDAPDASLGDACPFSNRCSGSHEELQRLPGVGPKSAQRLAFHVKMPRELGGEAWRRFASSRNASLTVPPATTSGRRPLRALSQR